MTVRRFHPPVDRSSNLPSEQLVAIAWDSDQYSDYLDIVVGLQEAGLNVWVETVVSWGLMAHRMVGERPFKLFHPALKAYQMVIDDLPPGHDPGEMFDSIHAALSRAYRDFMPWMRMLQVDEQRVYVRRAGRHQIVLEVIAK